LDWLPPRNYRKKLKQAVRPKKRRRQLQSREIEAVNPTKPQQEPAASKKGIGAAGFFSALFFFGPVGLGFQSFWPIDAPPF
jgi:hypothetical protein